MKRREFAIGVLGSGFALSAFAQAALTEGKDYVKLSTPVNVPVGGKIDVVEFFWYGCPHCNAFEPLLENWTKKLPEDVSFRRAPVSFSPMHETHAKLFYALEATGQLDAMHRKVFAALHVQRMRLDKEADIVDYINKSGGDGAKVGDAMKSFGVATKVRQAKQLSEAYKIDGVPTIGVHGRWFTSPALAGGPEKALAVTNQLIQRARTGA